MRYLASSPASLRRLISASVARLPSQTSLSVPPSRATAQSSSAVSGRGAWDRISPASANPLRKRSGDTPAIYLFPLIESFSWSLYFAFLAYSNLLGKRITRQWVRAGHETMGSSTLLPAIHKLLGIARNSCSGQSEWLLGINRNRCSGSLGAPSEEIKRGLQFCHCVFCVSLFA